MRTRTGAVALAAVAVMALSPATARWPVATTRTWTVRPGGAITATAGKTDVADTTTHNVLSCVSSRMSGTIKSGSGLPSTGIGSVTTAAYDCAMPIGPPFRLTPNGLPWHLSLISYDGSTGVSRGTISGFKLALAGPSCNAVINGTSGTTPDGVVTVTYSDQTGNLRIRTAAGNLHWYHVDGCAGLVANGDPATVSSAYALSPPQTITSP